MQVVLKSQILAGGRGLGKFKSGLQGGVHVTTTKDIKGLAEKMLGQTLVTKQTGPAGIAMLPHHPAKADCRCCKLMSTDS
jgi:succinyl-CoA synthetase beta subunit